MTTPQLNRGNGWSGALKKRVPNPPASLDHDKENYEKRRARGQGDVIGNLLSRYLRLGDELDRPAHLPSRQLRREAKKKITEATEEAFFESRAL